MSECIKALFLKYFHLPEYFWFNVESIAQKIAPGALKCQTDVINKVNDYTQSFKAGI